MERLATLILQATIALKGFPNIFGNPVGKRAAGNRPEILRIDVEALLGRISVSILRSYRREPIFLVITPDQPNENGHDTRSTM
ncbi:hypothetical protein D3C81_797990 [compost metagenome]